MLRGALVGAAAFAAMEPVSYAAHRWVMHGPGWGLHRSHHRSPVPATAGPRRLAGPAGADLVGAVGVAPGRSWRAQLEANDAFPAIFAGVTIAGMAAGTRVPTLHSLVPAAVGVTAYGAAYALVHDLYTHRRFARLPALAPLQRLARAHALHHLDGGEPYGMLLPLVGRDEGAARRRGVGGAGGAGVAR